MGTLKPFKDSQIERVTGSFLAKKLCGLVIRKNHVCVPVSRSQQDDMLKIKFILEYKYIIPTELRSDNQNYLYFNSYSTLRLLKLILPSLKCTNHKKTLLKKLINRYKRSKLKLYLAGPIENSIDGGIGYRKIIKDTLRYTKAEFIDPCDFEFNNDHKSLKDFRAHHTLEETYWHTRKVIAGDCRGVQKVDAALVYCAEGIGFGTTSEATLCSYLNKPVYCIGGNLDILNTWFIGSATRFFSSINDFRETLSRGC